MFFAATRVVLPLVSDITMRIGAPPPNACKCGRRAAITISTCPFARSSSAAGPLAKVWRSTVMPSSRKYPFKFAIQKAPYTPTAAGSSATRMTIGCFVCASAGLLVIAMDAISAATMTAHAVGKAFEMLFTPHLLKRPASGLGCKQ